MVINGTEFIRGNFEVNHIRDYNLFYRIINILFFSSLSLVFSFFLLNMKSFPLMKLLPKII